MRAWNNIRGIFQCGLAIFQNIQIINEKTKQNKKTPEM